MHQIPALFNVDEDTIAEIIRVEGEASTRVDYPGVQSRKLDHFAWRHTLVEVKQLSMPVAGPALVHDLGVKLRIEVITNGVRTLQTELSNRERHEAFLIRR